MAPKKNSKQAEKGKSSGAKKLGGSKAVDDEEEQALTPTPEQLRAQVAVMQAEKVKEEKNRNRMQTERDKVATFWEIKKKEVELMHAELRNKDRELEELEERHQAEIKVYSQKMKHLLYEQQNIIASIKTDHELALKLRHEQFSIHEAELLNDQRALKQKLKELEIGYEDTIRQIKLDHAKEITKMRQEFDGNAKDIQQKADKKEDVTDMKKKEAANEKLMYEIAQENKRLTEPLARSLKEVENLRKMLAHYEKDKLSLQQSRLQYSEMLNKHKELEWKYRLLEESFEKVKSEKDEIGAKFYSNIFDVHKKCGLQSLHLQQKVQVLIEELERKEAQLGEIADATSLGSNEFTAVKDKMEMLESKNQEIRSLYYDNGKIRNACNNIIKAFEAKLAEYGIPLQEMGLPYYIADIAV